MADLETRLQVNSLRWICRLYSSPESFPALFLKNLLHTRNMQTFLLSKPKSITTTANGSSFYRYILKVWQQFHGFPPTDEAAVGREIVWNNMYVTDGRGAALQWDQ